MSSGLLGSPPDHLDRRTINSIHTRCSPLNLSAAPTHRSTGMSYCRADQSSKRVQEGVCVCVCVSKREEIPLPRAVCIYNINTPLHMSTSDNLLMTVYICPHKHFNHRCNTCYLYVDIFMIEKKTCTCSES